MKITPIKAFYVKDASWAPNYIEYGYAGDFVYVVGFGWYAAYKEEGLNLVDSRTSKKLQQEFDDRVGFLEQLELF